MNVQLLKVMILFVCLLFYYNLLLEEPPKMRETMKRIIKIKNKTFATDAAPAAIPPNPNNAATIATIKKITVQRNIFLNFSLIINFSCICIEKFMP